MRAARARILAACSSLLAACPSEPGEVLGELIVSMPRVEPGNSIPIDYVGGELGGSDNSPAFVFESFPEGTSAWAFMVEIRKNEGAFQPYFMTANHPPESMGGKIPEGHFNLDLPNKLNPTPGPDSSIFESAFGERVYHGPQPSVDDFGARYDVRFRFYALSTELPLADGFTREQFDQAARGKILDEVVIEAKYEVQ